METTKDREDVTQTNSFRVASNARPTFIRALCAEATQGGVHSYEDVGYSLAAALWNLGPYELDDDEWSADIERLGVHFDEGDDDAMWAWFRARLPRCMTLVPTRRRAAFVAGVKRAFEEDRVMSPDGSEVLTFKELTGAVVQVGDGRGFVVQAGNRRVVITAAHCLPHFPPCHAASYTHERTYANLLGLLGAKPSVWAEVLFAEPVSDLAVLGCPDNQELWEQAEAYEQLTDACDVLQIGDADVDSDARVLTLRGKWVPITQTTVECGMSGSPIVASGVAIGAISTGSYSFNPRLTRDLPGWMLANPR
jgi:hypothetical protein